jgi:dolichol-phosphate mannosyltransferase
MADESVVVARSNGSAVGLTRPDAVPVRPTGGVAQVVLPAFNEQASLPGLLARLAATARHERMVVWVVDDGSVDGTAAVAAEGYPGLDVRLVRHARNRGLGAAVQTGIRSALAAADPDDYVVVMDADDTHDPALIALLRTGLEAGADIVICSRFVDGGDDRTAPAFRRLLSRGAAVTFRRFLQVENVHDFTSGYRAYRVDVLAQAAKHWGERLIEERGFACMVELLLKLRHFDPVVAEVPLVLQYDRKQGASKLKLRRTIGQYVTLIVRDRLSPAPERTA